MSDDWKITPAGYNIYEVISAVQKYVRRGIEHKALYFATEAYMSNPGWIWNRMIVMSMEDIGIANPDAVVQVQTLKQVHDEMASKNKQSQPELLPFTQAVLVLVRSKKSRLVDNKACYYKDCRHLIDRPEMDDYVYDLHTYKGKKMGRGNEHFFEEAATISNVNVADVPDEHEFRYFVQGLYEKMDNGELPKAGYSPQSDDPPATQSELFV